MIPINIDLERVVFYLNISPVIRDVVKCTTKKPVFA
jgi:hypothetical protein